MTNRLVPGERKKETARWAFLFGNLYIDASDNPEFQRIYPIYLQELSNNHQLYALYRLKLIHFLSKSKAGRSLFKAAMRIKYMIQLFFEIITSLKIAK
jgi:hypothetical protein